MDAGWGRGGGPRGAVHAVAQAVPRAARGLWPGGRSVGMRGGSVDKWLILWRAFLPPVADFEVLCFSRRYQLFTLS